MYQSLLNRGWRRSGRQLYKPDLRASCCPQYTIRLDSYSFHASKDQRQTLNRFNQYVLGDAYIQEAARLYPLSRDQAKKRNTNFDLLERVHESEKEHIKPPEPEHSVVVTLEPDDFTQEKFDLFEDYQRVVHHEPPYRITKFGFKNFLCSSPLSRSREIFEGRERRLGSWHQCYRLDGRLVAIGCLDLLPNCVSTVYFMYHESVIQHGFGKLGALREIALAKEESYRWWYAGFYIHSCGKMRYKGAYSPQYVLDPQSYDWDPLDEEMRKKWDEKKYFSLSYERATSSNVERGPPPTDGAAATTNVDAAEAPEDGENSRQIISDLGYEIPLFARSMPGILTKEQILREVDLDHIKIRLGTIEAETCDLTGWSISNIDNPHTMEGAIAELAAAVGPEVTKEMVVSFDGH